MDDNLFESDGHRNKRLLWIVNESKEHYSLSVERSASSFVLPKETVIATSARTDFSDNVISFVRKSVDEENLEKMERANKYQFLPMVCDFVIFQDSPLARAKYSN
jgi:hypothetical protein